MQQLKNTYGHAVSYSLFLQRNTYAKNERFGIARRIELRLPFCAPIWGEGKMSILHHSDLF